MGTLADGRAAFKESTTYTHSRAEDLAAAGDALSRICNTV
jgi:hypothetical protein